jgi:hypothetical protein
MELLRDTRVKIGDSILSKKRERVKRKCSYTNISQIKNIGIVWDASKTSDFSCLSRFYQKMHERNIDVRILGYFPGKDLPDQYTALRYFTCIRKNEINLFYVPTSTEARVFINTSFDILIDLNFDRIFTLSYISTLSSAKFKVGLFDSESSSSIFDLMMEIKRPVQIENYLTQVIHYLEMINSATGDQANKQ